MCLQNYEQNKLSMPAKTGLEKGLRKNFSLLAIIFYPLVQ